MSERTRRVAVLCDIHGNLPALEAVLAEVDRTRPDLIVIGGDVVPGPMPRVCMDRLLALDPPVRFVHGNCERAVLALMESDRTGQPVTYWGSVSGNPPPSPFGERMAWSARQLGPELGRTLAAWPRTVQLDIDGLGRVLFCHSTPRSETEVFTRLTAESKLRPIFDPLGVDMVVCGHTHLPFDRTVGGTRIVNPGSVGAPIGRTGAHWALLGPTLELHRTDYDLAATAEAFRRSGYPAADEQAEDLLHPPDEAETLALYATAELS